MSAMSHSVRAALAIAACAGFYAVAAYAIAAGASPWPRVFVLVVVATLAMLWVLYGPYEAHLLRRERKAKGLCVACGYDLTGNVSGVCPECGTKSR